MKVARTVRRRVFGKGQQCTSPGTYPTSEKRRSEKSVKTARGIAVVRAVVQDGKGGIATGTKMEKAASFSDWLEKAETSAIGRALAALGYGTQFAPDLDEAHRVVDAPVDRTPVSANSNSSNSANGSVAAARASSNASTNGNGAVRDENAEASVTEQQLASIRKLCQHLGKSEPDNVTSISFMAAKRLIQQLTAEYKLQSRKRAEGELPPAATA